MGYKTSRGGSDLNYKPQNKQKGSGTMGAVNDKKGAKTQNSKTNVRSMHIGLKIASGDKKGTQFVPNNKGAKLSSQYYGSATPSNSRAIVLSPQKQKAMIKVMKAYPNKNGQPSSGNVVKKNQAARDMAPSLSPAGKRNLPYIGR